MADELDKAEIPEYSYKVKYNLEFDIGDYPRGEVLEDNLGGCDAFAFFSILYPPDGSFSITSVTVDGKTGKELEKEELFKLWIVLGAMLGKDTDLSDFKREFAKYTTDSFFQILSGEKPSKPV